MFQRHGFTGARIRIGLLAFLVFAGGAPALAQDSAPQIDLPRMEQVVQSYAAGKQFMGAVLVARDGKVVFSHGYGDANAQWNIPNAPDTRFRLGSLTKQFTAAAILLLEERGKLNIDDPVKKYMPDAPAAWDKITIYNVLTHTAGIPNFTSFPDYKKTEPFAATPAELVARFKDKPLDFQPGEGWNYSNSGYVTGKNGLANAGYIDMTIPFSAGAIYSTTEDLLRWQQGLFGGKLLSAASLKKMTTPFKQDYAFGLIVTRPDGHLLISHNGGIEGFNTRMDYYPDDRLSVIVLGNVNGRAPEDIASKLGTVALGKKVVLTSERKTVAVDAALVGRYLGSYRLADGPVVVISREGDHVFAQLGNQPKVEIFPASDTQFFLTVFDAQVDFIAGKDAPASEMVLHQGGRDVRAARIAN